MTSGLVSVVMPAFDEEAFIGEAVASVLAQTYRSFELIVVDDASSDRTAAVAAGFDGVRVVSRAVRGGPAAARNAGLAEASGEYWTIFDADDVMPPDRLAVGVAYLAANPSIELVLGRTEAFVTPGEPRPSHWNPAWDGGPYHGHPGTGLGRRSVLDQVGLFDESLGLGSDMQWLARAKLAGVPIGRVDDLLLRYRIHAGNVTADVRANRANMLTALRTARTFAAERVDRPTVGVAIPVYNGAAYLGDALRSVLAQSHPVADVVVVDDGSSDESAAVASAFGPLPRVIRQPHRGVGPARSRAIEAVRGDVIVVLDADDLLTEDSVASRLRVLEDRPEVDLVFGHVRTFAEVGADGPLALDDPRPAHVTGSMLLRRLAYERVGGFRAGLRAEGLDWLLRARELGLIDVTVAEQVLWRRVHAANSSLGDSRPLQEFPRLLKESLDRRRAAGQVNRRPVP